MSLPRTSYALIDQLDKQVPPAASLLPTHAQGWAHFSPQAVQAMAYQAGRRSIVDELVDIKREEMGEITDPVAQPEDTRELPPDTGGLSYRVLSRPRVDGSHVEAPLGVGHHR